MQSMIFLLARFLANNNNNNNNNNNMKGYNNNKILWCVIYRDIFIERKLCHHRGYECISNINNNNNSLSDEWIKRMENHSLVSFRNNVTEIGRITIL